MECDSWRVFWSRQLTIEDQADFMKQILEETSAAKTRSKTGLAANSIFFCSFL